MSESAPTAGGEGEKDLGEALRAIGADLDRVLAEISELEPDHLAELDGPVSELEVRAASLRERMEWIRWRAGQDERGRPTRR